MSIDFEPGRQRYRARWREAGRQRSRRFATRDEAEAFAATLERPAPSAGCSSGAAGGRRWRRLRLRRSWRPALAVVFRQSDGSLTTRRGFSSRSAAVAARRTAIEQVRRGEVRASREPFAEFWAALLEAKRPYVTAGTLQDYATQGRKRLLPRRDHHRGRGRRA